MLKFIIAILPNFCVLPVISKHLMLKFILATDSGLAVATPDFKTSHVKVYLWVARQLQFGLFYFKTSHVKVYRSHGYSAGKLLEISKHLMLKFIGLFGVQERTEKNFKTSHVKVYLYRHSIHGTFVKYFKTSHVKVYQRCL